MLKSLSPIAFVVGVLAVWRVTHLFYGEDGPWLIFVRLRRAVGNGFWGGLLDCFYCLSLWFAIPLAWRLGDTWLDRVVLWLALSAGAICIERGVESCLAVANKEQLNGSQQPPPLAEYSVSPATPSSNTPATVNSRSVDR